MVWEYISSVNLENHHQWRKYIEVSENIRPSRQHLLLRGVLAYFSKTKLNLKLHLLQQQGFIIKWPLYEFGMFSATALMWTLLLGDVNRQFLMLLLLHRIILHINLFLLFGADPSRPESQAIPRRFWLLIDFRNIITTLPYQPHINPERVEKYSTHHHRAKKKCCAFGKV